MKTDTLIVILCGLLVVWLIGAAVAFTLTKDPAVAFTLTTDPRIARCEKLGGKLVQARPEPVCISRDAILGLKE